VAALRNLHPETIPAVSKHCRLAKQIILAQRQNTQLYHQGQPLHPGTCTLLQELSAAMRCDVLRPGCKDPIPRTVLFPLLQLGVYSLTELVTTQHKRPAVITTEDLARKYAGTQRPHKVALNKLTYLLNTPRPDHKELANICDGKMRTRPQRVVHNTDMFTELSEVRTRGPSNAGAPATPAPSQQPDAPANTTTPPAPAEQPASPAGASCIPTVPPPQPAAPQEGQDPPPAPAPALPMDDERQPHRLRQATLEAYLHMFAAPPTAPPSPATMHPGGGDTSQPAPCQPDGNAQWHHWGKCARART